MIAYNSFNIKLFFFILLIISIGLPINNIINLFFLIIGIILIHFVDLKNANLIKRKNIIIIIFIAIISQFIENKNIEEAHSSFFSNADIKIISKFLPTDLINKIKKDYNENFEFDRAMKSSNSFNLKKEFHDNINIKKPYSFSSDNYFTKSKYTRYIDKINFSSRESLRVGQFNSLNYNLLYDKEFRRIIPYYVLYKIPHSYYNSKICTIGKAFFSYGDKDFFDFKINDFKKFPENCISYNKESQYLYIFGYSINDKDNLEIKLHKNNYYFFLLILKIILQIILLVLFYKSFFEFKKQSLFDISVFIISITSFILFVYLKDIHIISGLRYFRGGADGLFHEFQGNEIVRHLYNFNFIEALRGGADIFYFMPGMRYFIALGKIFFGDNSYFYIIITLLLPIYIYKLLKNIISEKISFYILILFLILPIFENMGFGYFNFIHQLVRNHAETLSITIIIYCLSKISSSRFVVELDIFKVFFYCFILAFATFCRPNFLPTSTIIFLYIFYLCLNKNYIISFIAIFGYSFTLVSLVHNVYFGNDFSFFTKSNVHFVFNDIFQNLNYSNIKDNKIIYQILKWNPYYNIHRLLILILVIYFYFKNKNNIIISILFSSAIAQHIVLLLTHPDSRYAYLAWMLTLICFFYYLFNNYLHRFK